MMHYDYQVEEKDFRIKEMLMVLQNYNGFVKDIIFRNFLLIRGAKYEIDT